MLAPMFDTHVPAAVSARPNCSTHQRPLTRMAAPDFDMDAPDFPVTVRTNRWYADLAVRVLWRCDERETPVKTVLASLGLDLHALSQRQHQRGLLRWALRSWYSINPWWDLSPRPWSTDRVARFNELQQIQHKHNVQHSRLCCSAQALLPIPLPWPSAAIAVETYAAYNLA